MGPRFSRSVAVAVLAFASSVTGCSGSTLHSPPETVGLTEPVRDGTFVFIVTQVDFGEPILGLAHPRGVFVFVRLSVKNIGEDDENLYCQYQRLKDLAGRNYDDAVNGHVGEDAVHVGPGKQVDAMCAFDVPTGTLPAAVQVHEFEFSTGATVTVLGRV
jgi:hypothetical protein